MTDPNPTARSALDLDRLALAQLADDVAQVSEADLARPTPCAGWTVRDLLAHMNTEHAAICGAEFDNSADPRTVFPSVVLDWLTFAGDAGDTIFIPKMGGALPADMVLSTHFVDMLVHRWDLAAALGKATGTTPALLVPAHQIADVITAPGSPLVGVAYQPALPPAAEDSSEDALVRKLGRDPRWPLTWAEQQPAEPA